MPDNLGEFWIDVGGTFTDCIHRRPNGTLRTHKLPSNGRYPATLSWQPQWVSGAPNPFLRDAPGKVGGKRAGRILRRLPLPLPATRKWVDGPRRHGL